MSSSLQFKVLFWLSILVWVATLLLSGEGVGMAFFRPATHVLPVIGAIVWLFDRYLWRWRGLYPWFVKVPDLSGLYRGEFKSRANNKEGTGSCYVVIIQFHSSLCIRYYTPESESVSIAYTFESDREGCKELSYIYRNEPGFLQRESNPIHYGTARLKVVLAESPHLIGYYWTDRFTGGELKLARISSEQPRSIEACQQIAERLRLEGPAKPGTQ